mmetsp:Transcript_26058/g.63602  ORF Transcript_26058/g.63602 Transcript_26058/m.63602 type:complete len:183 (+) Transcript_26058:84-632(+)
MSSAASRFQRIFTPKRVRVLKKIAAGGAVASVPVLAWWKMASDERAKKSEEVRTKVRVPNVQTIDDIMIERCRPGDVLLFDRRWETCASGPLAALVCVLGRYFLCFDDPNKVLPEGKFDHCGIVVPGYAKNKKRGVGSFQHVVTGGNCWWRNCCTAVVDAIGNVQLSQCCPITARSSWGTKE